ncbi:glycosyltransferase [Fulvivirga sediminis]|uniref:Glycosyltransferase n=1 Tax=Fulvivirga sediminis TaxID=2803949 RepID=A0A937F5E1_9BACT|nr:glycosyltransferase [Fulvivirga sediminis]MBL3654974.1 glycosyltransferase [Fulvivirga sediminis]
MHSKSILFITPYPPGEAPSQRFRFEQYLKLLKNKGFSIDFQPFLTEGGWFTLYKDGKFILKLYHLTKGFVTRFLTLFKIYKYDFIFIHREASPAGPPVFEWFISKILNKKIIYDFDDAIWLEDPDEVGSIKSKIKWKGKVKRICQWSWKVSAGNQFLAGFAAIYCKNVVVIPTTIDTIHQHTPSSKDSSTSKKLVIGWTGTHSTLQYLKPLVPVIQQLEKEYDFEFLVISNKKPNFKLKSLRFTPWNKQSEIADLQKIDIGIMPLTDDLWSQGKCGFKALQYMALEIPALASPVGVNNQIIDNAINGYLCKTDIDWLKYLRELLHDSVKRQRMGEQARVKIERNYSVSAVSSEFLSLFKVE